MIAAPRPAGAVHVHPLRFYGSADLRTCQGRGSRRGQCGLTRRPRPWQCDIRPTDSRGYRFADLRTCGSTVSLCRNTRPPAGPGSARCPWWAVAAPFRPTEIRIYGLTSWPPRVDTPVRCGCTTMVAAVHDGRVAPQIRICGSTYLRSGCNRGRKVCVGSRSSFRQGEWCCNPTEFALHDRCGPERKTCRACTLASSSASNDSRIYGLTELRQPPCTTRLHGARTPG